VGLAQWAPVEHLRKAELSNGRSAMLATVGWFWPAYVGTFNSDDVTTTDPIQAILQADPQWWAQWVIFCGTIEAIKFRGEQEGKSYTGDAPEAAIDWTGTWAKLDDAQKEDMRLKELKNGRLAMLGFAGLVSDYFIPGSVPGTPHF
jgi:Chlorophyll A-B binding protein